MFSKIIFTLHYYYYYYYYFLLEVEKLSNLLNFEYLDQGFHFFYFFFKTF